jgi:diguanylate cyclase (GGDEF)-like protein
MRGDLFDAMRAVQAAYSATPGAVAPYEELITRALGQHDVALRAWALEVRGAQAWAHAKFDVCVEHLSAAIDAYRRTGQVRRTVVAASNLAGALSNINDHATALTHLEQALELARRTGSPRNIGTCLMQTAHTLFELGQMEAAQSYILEAQHTLAPLPPNRSHAILLQVLGDVHLALKRPMEALQHYKEQAEFALNCCDLLHQVIAVRGQAAALNALNRFDDAAAAVESGLALVRLQGNPLVESELLETMALIEHARSGNQCPKQTQRTPALHYLHASLQAAKAMSDKHPRVKLLRLLAAHHAAEGEHAQAYHFSEWASRARDEEQSEAAVRQATALEIRHKLAQTQAQAEHHAALAQEQTHRAETLAEHGETLMHLGAIGQQITAQLNAENVFAALNQHVHSLLDADCLSIFLVSQDGTLLEQAFGVEAGEPLPPVSLALDAPDSLTSACARTRTILILEQQDTEEWARYQQAGTLAMQSALFAPLTVGEQLLGVLTLQSQRASVYGKREQTILSSLCAYGAIALENARVHSKLQQTLRELHEAQSALQAKNNALAELNTHLQEASVTDPLTGLRNRRSLLQQIPSDVAMSLRGYKRGTAEEPPPEADMAFLLLDLDHFKRVNDVHGHRAGDAVLSTIGGRLRSVCRDTDYLVRWGGEEFLIVARQTSRHRAAELAERVRRCIFGTPFLTNAGPISLSASVGFACYPFDPRDPAAVSWARVVDLADQALYQAKAAGRNCWRGYAATGTEASHAAPSAASMRLIAEDVAVNL